MKQIIGFPPNIEKIRKAFDIEDKPVVFTYGDILYNPLGGHVSKDLEVHELTHTKQQGSSPEDWWDRYINDKQFRLDQEIEAYRNQYEYYCRKNKSLNAQFRFLRTLSHYLSSEVYGNLVTRSEAMDLINIQQ